MTINSQDIIYLLLGVN